MTVCRRGPRFHKNEGSPRVSDFSGLNGRRRCWLSTLRSAAHTAPRKTRFRLLAKLYRVGLVAHKLQGKVSEVIVTSYPPFPSFTWRKTKNRPDSKRSTAVL